MLETHSFNLMGMSGLRRACWVLGAGPIAVHTPHSVLPATPGAMRDPCRAQETELQVVWYLAQGNTVDRRQTWDKNLSRLTAGPLLTTAPGVLG